MNNDQVTKQEYQAPTLIELGSLSDLTLNTTGAGGDGGTFSAA